MLKPARIPRAVCKYALGPNHSMAHRMYCGGFIMLVGVTIAKAAHAIDVTAVSYSIDLVGYMIHGLGAVPFIQYLVED